MKCKREGCNSDLEKCVVPAGAVYCSRLCAPYGLLGSTKHTHLDPEPASSSRMENGARSGNYSEEGQDFESGTETRRKSSGITRIKLSEIITPETQKKSEPEQEKSGPIGRRNEDVQTQENHESGNLRIASTTDSSGETGTPKTGSDIAFRRSSVEITGTQAEGSPEPSQSFEPVISISMGLIDKSAKHLFGLMRSIGKDREPGDVRQKPIDTNQINAACNCAKQIQQLMKLKLDIAKEMRRELK